MTLAVNDISCDRSGYAILRKTRFSVASGQAAILRGPNGVGKSTLLRVLAGLTPPIEGDCTIDGVSLHADLDLYHAQLAYFGHLDAIKPQLSVAENLEFWARIFGDGDIATALETFELGDIRARAARICSAGQKRRLGLARLALARRKIWLLDEPTVSLDHAACALLTKAIDAHCSTGGIAVIATHIDMALATETQTITLTPFRIATTPDEQRDPFLAGDML